MTTSSPPTSKAVVRVAIDLALDRLFDYEVPEALQEKLAVGQLLSVPFGHREARGFALEIEEGVRRETGDGGGASRLASRVSCPLKPITAIVDETPFFSPALLKLVKKVAAYTAAPLESVLRAALPAAVLKRNARAKEQLFVEPTVFYRHMIFNIYVLRAVAALLTSLDSS